MNLQHLQTYQQKLIIIGAGINGLTLANSLQKSTKSNITIIEKSSSVGGRMSTRWFDLSDNNRLYINHGCPYFESSQEKWASKNGVNRVDGNVYGINGINTIAKGINIDDSTILFDQKVVQVNKLEDTRWSVTTLSKESTLQLHECHHLFLCAPFPQSFELIKHILTQKETAELTKCRYTKCIVMMFVVDEREVAFINKYGHEVEKMVIGVGSLVVHMTHAFSLSNYTKSNLELEEMILDRVDPVLRDKPKSLKKWGFARPEVCLKGSFWRSRRLQGLSLSGDYFQQVESNVETSIMSAQYAAMDYLTRRN